VCDKSIFKQDTCDKPEKQNKASVIADQQKKYDEWGITFHVLYVRSFP